MVRNRQSLFHVIGQYVVPQHLDQKLKPAEKWLHDLCNARELVSFSHKKQAIEEIKDAVLKEVERRRLHQKVADNLSAITGHLTALDGTTAATQQPRDHDQHRKDEKNEKDNQIMSQFKMLMKVDPVRAHKLIEPRAREYMLDWDDEAVPSHQSTVKNWHSLWETNQEFEEYILAEEKWYK